MHSQPKIKQKKKKKVTNRNYVFSHRGTIISKEYCVSACRMCVYINENTIDKAIKTPFMSKSFLVLYLFSPYIYKEYIKYIKIKYIYMCVS